MHQTTYNRKLCVRVCVCIHTEFFYIDKLTSHLKVQSIQSCSLDKIPCLATCYVTFSTNNSADKEGFDFFVKCFGKKRNPVISARRRLGLRTVAKMKKEERDVTDDGDAEWRSMAQRDRRVIGCGRLLRGLLGDHTRRAPTRNSIRRQMRLARDDAGVIISL